eukprot:g10981.t1
MAREGTYMDLDMLSFQSLDLVGENAIGVEATRSLQKSHTVDSDKLIVNSAILANFNDNSTYLANLLSDFINDFAGTRWGHNGPKLLTRTLQKNAQGLDASVYDGHTFFPVHWNDIRLFFDPAAQHVTFLNRIRTKSVTVHLWNSLISPHLRYISSSSVLSHMMETACPITHASFTFDLDYIQHNLKLGIKLPQSSRTGSPETRHDLFKVVSPILTKNYGNVVPDLQIEILPREQSYKYLCYAIKRRGSLNKTQQIVSERCAKVQSKGLFKSKLMPEKYSSDTPDGWYTLFVWLSNHANEHLKATTPRVITFVIGFKRLKSIEQFHKLSEYMALITRPSNDAHTLENLYNVAILHEKIDYTGPDAKPTDMPSFNFIEKGLLPELEAAKNSRLKSWVIGPGHACWDSSRTIFQNLQFFFGNENLSTLDLVLVLPPPWPDDYDEQSNPTSLPPQQIKFVSQYVPIGFRQAELVANFQVTNLRLNLLNASYLFAPYKNEIDDFVRLKPSWIVGTSAKRKIIYAPHAASKNMFSCDGNFNDDFRDYDVALTGKLNYQVYPLRSRLYRLFHKHARKLPFRVSQVGHPGYALSAKTAEKQLKDYSNFLKKTKINLVTSSIYGRSVAKYVESQLAGALIIGSIPLSRQDYYRNFVVEISSTDSDDYIISTIQWWLDHPEERYAKARQGYIYGLRETWKTFSYSITLAIDHWHAPINSILVSSVDDLGYRMNAEEPVKDNRSKLLALGDYQLLKISGFQSIIRKKREVIYMHVCSCANSITHLRQMLDLQLVQFQVYEACSNIAPSSGQNGHSSFRVVEHVFLCDQYPFHLTALGSTLSVNLVMNYFPGAAKALYKYVDEHYHDHGYLRCILGVSPNVDSLDCLKSQWVILDVFVIITSLTPMRIWLIREGIDVNEKNGSVDWGIQIQMLTRHLKESTLADYSASSYQVLQIKVQLSATEFEEERPRKAEYNVSILEVDVSPVLSKHHSKWRQAVLRKAYSVAFRMKGVYTDIVYLPEIELQKWLSENHFCNEFDCSNRTRLRRLSAMLLEVVIARDSSTYLVWPEDINSPEVSPAYFAHFDDDDLTLYHTFFNIVNNRRPKPVYGDLTAD